MKTTFKTFLREYAFDDVTLVEAAEYVKAHCMIAWTAETRLYRGSNLLKAAAVVARPVEGYKRVATTSFNIVNVLTSGSPNWKDYPRRDKSLMAANNKGIAMQYSPNVYRIFPVDNAKIGMSIREDFWGSFDYMEKMIGIDTIEDLETLIIYMFKKILDRDTAVIAPITLKYWQLTEKFLAVDKELASKGVDVFKSADDSDLQPYLCKPKDALLDAFAHGDSLAVIENLLNPDKNNFVVGGTKEMLHAEDSKYHEFWTDAECVAVDLTFMARLEELMK